MRADRVVGVADRDGHGRAACQSPSLVDPGVGRRLGPEHWCDSSWSDDVLLETLLPLGKVASGLRAAEMPLDLHSIAAEARLVKEIGYDGLVVEETNTIRSSC